MAQMSDYLEEKIIDAVFRNTTYTSPALVYVTLYSTDPTDADTGTELEVGTSPGYARISAAFDAPTDGVTSNTADILFAAATGDWTAITHIGIRDAITGGNLLMHKILTTPVSVIDTNSFRIPAGQLTITLA